MEEDDAVLADPASSPRERVASRLLRIEKSILFGTPHHASVARLPSCSVICPLPVAAPTKLNCLYALHPQL